VIQFNEYCVRSWFSGESGLHNAVRSACQKCGIATRSACIVFLETSCFEENKSTILIVLRCAASGAELQLELFSEIGDLQIAMRPAHHRWRSSRPIDSISKSEN